MFAKSRGNTSSNNTTVKYFSIGSILFSLVLIAVLFFWMFASFQFSKTIKYSDCGVITLYSDLKHGLIWNQGGDKTKERIFLGVEGVKSVVDRSLKSVNDTLNIKVPSNLNYYTDTMKTLNTNLETVYQAYKNVNCLSCLPNE